MMQSMVVDYSLESQMTKGKTFNNGEFMINDKIIDKVFYQQSGGLVTIRRVTKVSTNFLCEKGKC